MEKIKKLAMKLAVALAVFTPLFMVVSALGVKFGLWGWKLGFGTLVRGYGVKLLMLTLIVALIALVLSLIVKPRKGVLAALLALAVPVVGMGYGKHVKKTAMSLPFIHDITTDTVDVPAFSTAMVELRKGSSNALGYIGTKDPRSKKLVSEEQAAAYSDIKTLDLQIGTDAAYEKSIAAMKSMGFEIVTLGKADGIIEATATSFWFGFKDDVVIRIRPANPNSDNGSIIDIRSISRHGASDLGMNAKRVREISAKITG